MSTATARPTLHLPARYLAIVQDILRRYLPQAEVWAYGSRVQGDHYDASDLDLVVRQPDDLTRPQPDLDEVAAAFSDSDLPILVQILDWARIPEAFREEIEACYVVLRAAASTLVAPRDAGSHLDCSPSSALESGPVSSASRAESVKQGFGSRVPTLCLGTRKIHVGDLLNEPCADIQTGPFGTKLKAAQYTSNGVPVISVREVGYDRLQIHLKTPRVDETITRNMPEYLLKPGDIVFGRKGAVDRSALVLEDQGGWFLGSDGIRLRLPSSCDAGFMSYQFQAPRHREWMIRHAAGTTMASLNESIIRRIPIVLPPLGVQRAIAAVLGALDDKIEQNRRTAQALERLALAIFRAWFLDFEPVRAKAAGATSFLSMPQPVFDCLPTRLKDSEIGLVPEGWSLLPLYETAEFINGAAFKNTHFCGPGSGLPVVKIAELKNGITDQTKYSDRTDLDEKYKIDTGEILYSWSGSPDTSLDVFLWTEGRAFLNQHIFRVVTRSDAQKHFAYYLLKQLRRELIEIAKNKPTTGLGHVTVADMRRLSVCWPAPGVLDAFEQQVGPIFRLGFALSMESESLTRIRDYLLPKLLSGRVRVKDAERSMEEDVQ